MASLSADFAKRLGGFDLEVDEVLGAGVTALIGPSGAGKTTLLRCLAGLETPDRGRLLNGEAVWFDAARRVDVPVQQRGIGFVFQEHALFPHLSVEANVRFAAKRTAWADELLEWLEVAALRRQHPAQISAGQRQRVAIARALASEPSWLLMDEPFAALDPHLRQRLARDFAALRRRLELPVVLVTHDLDEAASLADHWLVLGGGRVRQAGSPAEVLDRPADPEVAQWVGMRNLHAGTLTPEGHLRWGPHPLILPASPRLARACRWGIRAEAVRVAEQAGGGENWLPAELLARETTGRGVRLRLNVPGAGEIEAWDGLGASGERLWVQLPPSGLRVFPG